MLSKSERCRVAEKNEFDFSNGTYGTYTIYGHVKRHTPQPHELSAYMFIGEPMGHIPYMVM